MHGHRPQSIYHQIERQRYQLADAGGECRAAHAELRERPDTEDEQRIQHDICHTAEQQRRHGHLHATHRLINLLECEADHDNHRKRKRDGRVLRPHLRYLLGICEQPQETRHNGDAHDHAHHAMDNRARNTARRRRVCLISLTGTEMIRNHRVDAHAEADSERVYQILHRINQRQCCYRVLTYFCNKQAVDDVIQRVHQHGNHHRQRH